MIGLAALVSVLGAAAGAAAAPASPSCTEILPDKGQTGPQRALTPEDLVRLRDIGPPHAGPVDGRLFTVSPDGRRAAFQLRRADPLANSYCLAMVVVPIDGAGKPVVVNEGGELIRTRFDYRGKAGLPTGIPAPITPRWSPDSRWIAFLRRDDGRTQVWRAAADGTGAAPLTASEDDIEDFRLSSDGQAIIYASRPGLREAEEAIAREGRSGFHYDDRYAPVSSSRPFAPMPVPVVASTMELATGQLRPATEEERRRLARRDCAREENWLSSRSRDGRLAWIEPGPDPYAPGTLIAQGTGRQPVTCLDPECSGATRPWWTADGLHVRYVRREGWSRSTTAIYEWTPGIMPPRRLFATEDVLADCAPDGDALLCLRESALQPRRLERLDPVTGRAMTLLDPNPGFGRLALGQVERLRWRNVFGLEAFGDLVLPVGYQPGQRYPLVVVQYDARGFLRGGTGDEYPIQAFANRGYAVLSVSRPATITPEHEIAATATEPSEILDRRSTLSSVETAVRRLIGRGIADPQRIGITGMSDGATTAIFALLHSRLFSAVALSSCCIDTTTAMRVGPAGAKDLRRWGYPGLTEPADAFWSEISLRRNAKRIPFPLLVQVSDDEFISALESVTALREVNAPVDLYIYPQEHHVKWQPAHRLAVYQRALDWFDYWLRGLRSDDPQRQRDLSYWDSLKAGAARGSD